MSTADYVRDKIGSLSKGYVFTYSDFITEANSKEAIIKVLNRMAAAGKIAKLAKGKFYKPEQTPFGELLPDERQTVKDLLEKDGKLIGYITGFTIYNRLGLTTQVSNVIQIGRPNVRPATTRGKYKVTFVRQKNTITKENIPMLQLLDAIKNIKKIPGATIAASCKRLLGIIKNLSTQEVKTAMRLAIKYPPATRAMLGALLNQVQPDVDTSPLLKSLNPITKYSIDIDDTILAYAQKWNLV